MLTRHKPKYYSDGSWIYTDANDSDIFKILGGASTGFKLASGTFNAIGDYKANHTNDDGTPSDNKDSKSGDTTDTGTTDNIGTRTELAYDAKRAALDNGMYAMGGRIFAEGGSWSDMNGWLKAGAISGMGSSVVDNFKNSISMDTSKVNAAKLAALQKMASNNTGYSNSMDSLMERWKNNRNLRTNYTGSDFRKSGWLQALAVGLSAGTGAATGALYGGGYGALIGAAVGLGVGAAGIAAGNILSDKNAGIANKVGKGLNTMSGINLTANANYLDKQLDRNRLRHETAEGGYIDTGENVFAGGGIVIAPRNTDSALSMQAYNSALQRMNDESSKLPNYQSTYFLPMVSPMKSFAEGGELLKNAEALNDLRDIHGDRLALEEGLELEIDENVYKALVRAGVGVSRKG